MQFIIYLNTSSDAELTRAITFKPYMNLNRTLCMSVCMKAFCALWVYTVQKFYWNV